MPLMASAGKGSRKTCGCHFLKTFPTTFINLLDKYYLFGRWAFVHKSTQGYQHCSPPISIGLKQFSQDKFITWTLLSFIGPFLNLWKK